MAGQATPEESLGQGQAAAEGCCRKAATEKPQNEKQAEKSNGKGDKGSHYHSGIDCVVGSLPCCGLIKPRISHHM